ncbi:MAG TPA: hypothetical protein VNL94_06785 [Candidatus Binatia bacterium]|nr:hypothetical protein [Candidatus Binatia bacterium]
MSTEERVLGVNLLRSYGYPGEYVPEALRREPPVVDGPPPPRPSFVEQQALIVEDLALEVLSGHGRGTGRDEAARVWAAERFDAFARYLREGWAERDIDPSPGNTTLRNRLERFGPPEGWRLKVGASQERIRD